MTKKQIFILIGILVIGAALRFRLAQDKCLHKWDERFHALVAKNVLKHPLKPTLYDDPVLPYDYKKWYANHVWVHKPPLPLWIIAASYSVFKPNEFYTRLPTILLSIAVVFMTFLLGKELFSMKVGLLGSFFMAINGFAIEMASGRIATDHYDSQFLAFTLFAVFFSFKNAQTGKWWYAIFCGVFLGCALLTKWLPAMIVIPIHFLFLQSYKRSLAQIAFYEILSVSLSLIIALPWQLYIRKHYPLEAAWEQHYNFLHFTQELEGHYDKEGWMFYLNRLRINYSEIIYLPLGFLLYRCVKDRTDYKKWALVAWIFIPLIIFSFAKMKLHGYILFTAPALLLVIADFFFQVKEQIAFKTKNTKILFRIVLVAIIVIPVRYCFERTQFGFSDPKMRETNTNYKALSGTLSEKCVVFDVEDPIEFMFYNNCIAYSGDIDEPTSTRLKSEGYRLFRYDPKLNRTIEFD